MKKTFFIVVIFVLCSIVFANDLMKSINDKIPLELPKNTGRPYIDSREVPEYEFIIEPTEIMMNYYDYMPGSYCGIPVQVQPEISQPNGFNAGGVYIIFHARETEEATRREYWAYFDAEGNLIDCSTIGNVDLHEGYGGIDIDPVTGDPIVAWHGDYDTQIAGIEVVCSYDLYHIYGTPGNWREPFVVINDTINSPNPPMDEFIWPYVHIGPSPDPDKRRVYIIANNVDNTPTGHPSENVLIAHADFDVNDLNQQSTFNWSYNSIPLLNQWHGGIPEWIRPSLSMCVSDDGKVALMGYITQDSIFVFLNENYGEGDYEYFSEDYRFDVNIPTYPNGYYFSFIHCNHMNSLFTDNNMKIRFMGTMGLKFEEYYWAYMIYPKIYTFDISSQEFSFYDLYIEGANPSDNNPMLPWDLNEDGIIDSLLPNGDPYMVEDFPLLYFDESTAYHVNTFKIVKNEEKGWLAAVWHDGLKSKYAHEGVVGYEEWLEVPEIAICISANNGESWSEPIFLNSIETPELSEMIPVYIYPGDLIEDLGDDHGKLHLFFLDDYEYGIYCQGGINLGGMQMYCSLDIDFGPFVSTGNETIPQVAYELYNYPNPFNPETKICFTVAQNAMSGSDGSSFVNIEIYNIKGQKVKTLRISNTEHRTSNYESVTWNGADENNRPVASGIYFYKLSINNKTKAVRKMILLR